MKTQMEDMKNENVDAATEPRRGRLRSLMRDTRGLNTVEYAILLVLIVFVSYGLWQSFGSDIGDGVKKANDEIQLGGVNKKQ